MDIHEIKLLANGRWVEILTATTGIDAGLLDGKHHPCPKCGGTDRFRIFDMECGAVLCNQCFSCGNGDGLSAMMWLLGCSLPDAIEKVAKYLAAERVPRKPPSQKKPKRVYPNAKSAVHAIESFLGRMACRWVYVDADGQPVGLVCRWDTDGGKAIRQVSRVDGGWSCVSMTPPRVLYNLPAVQSARRVWVCEGEKAADAACRLGLVATTSAGGSVAANRTDWTPLAGKDVVVIPDNDAPGRKYAKAVAATLLRLEPPASVRIMEIPGLPEGGDVADFCEAFASKGDEELVLQLHTWALMARRMEVVQ